MGKREPFLPTPRLSRSAPGLREDSKLNSSAGGTLVPSHTQSPAFSCWVLLVLHYFPEVWLGDWKDCPDDIPIESWIWRVPFVMSSFCLVFVEFFSQLKNCPRQFHFLFLSFHLYSHLSIFMSLFCLCLCLISFIQNVRKDKWRREGHIYTDGWLGGWVIETPRPPVSEFIQQKGTSLYSILPFDSEKIL